VLEKEVKIKELEGGGEKEGNGTEILTRFIHSVT
jgi:hypothetical protein